MTLAICSTELPAIKDIPKWGLPFVSGRITRIRTMETSEFQETLRLLEIWKNTYSRIPKGSDGEYVALHCYRRLATGKVLLAEDCKGIVQSIARVTSSADALYLEELIVAPWNNATCREFTASTKSWCLGDEDLEGLALKHSVSMGELTNPNRGIGTTMMYALCKLGLSLEEKSLTVSSVEDSVLFYEIIGMERGKDLHSYSFDLSCGIPAVLESKAGEYFTRL